MKIITMSDEKRDILFKQAEPVTKFDDELTALLFFMQVTMREAKGQGLAAPQVGHSICAIVLNDTRWPTLINPKIVFAKGSETRQEACLSVPGVQVDVQRATKIVVDAQDRHGKPIRINAKGPFARVIQHEIDHLNGKLIVGGL